MSLHAADNLSDAFVATREFLTPVEPGRWARLAVVVLFIGTGTTLPTGFDVSVPADDLPESASVSPPADAVFLAIAAAVVALVLSLLWVLVGSIMEFVLVESLRNEAVTLRRYWGQRWRQGLRLFGFRLGLALFGLVLVVAWLGLLLVPVATDTSIPGWALGLFLLGLPVFFVVGLLFALVYLFTTVFVVPIMIATDSGVLGAWRRLWPTIRAEWKEFLVYSVLVAVLTPALGLVVALVVGISAVVVALPLVAAGLAVWLTAPLSSTVGLLVVGTLLTVFLVVVSAIWALVQVPVVAYLRYYALLVLGDVEPSFDIIPDQRAAVRRAG